LTMSFVIERNAPCEVTAYKVLNVI
jgi:hypothetical protein